MFGYDPRLIFDGGQAPVIDPVETLALEANRRDTAIDYSRRDLNAIYNPWGGEYRDYLWSDSIRYAMRYSS